jgi:hypothetical protein
VDDRNEHRNARRRRIFHAGTCTWAVVSFGEGRERGLARLPS